MLGHSGRAALPIVLMRVLGRGGSSSRIKRRTSSSPASLNCSRLNGVLPVSNSYKSTPSE